MRKYFEVAKNTWNETISYRFNFVMWRVRTIIQLLTFYFLWSALIPKSVSIADYNHSLILTYILGTSFLSSFVMSSRSAGIGDEIISGDLSNYLIRPVNYFFYWFAKDLGDKAMNIVFAVVEFSILIFLLMPPLFLQTNILLLCLTLIAAIVGLTLYYFFNTLLGMIGFWTSEIWAPRFVFFTMMQFFAGGLFPLDLLPKPVFFFFSLTPFPYLLYFPIKIYLGQLSTTQIYIGLSVSFIWVFAMMWIVNKVWKRGLQVYTSQGR